MTIVTSTYRGKCPRRRKKAQPAAVTGSIVTARPPKPGATLIVRKADAVRA